MQQGQELRSLSRPLARYGEPRGCAPFPAASDGERRGCAEHQQHGFDAAVLLQRDARPRPRSSSTLTFVHEPRKLPVVLEPGGGRAAAGGGAGPKYKAALSVAYGAGLRVSEVVALKVSDIDTKRMMHPRRARQGPQGSLRDAVAAAVGAAARLVRMRPPAGLAVSRAVIRCSR